MSVFTCKLSSKGQITIPKDVRTRLGAAAGDFIDIAVENGQVGLRPHRAKALDLDRFVGVLEGTFPGGIAEINAWIKDMREGDEGDEGLQ